MSYHEYGIYKTSQKLLYPLLRYSGANAFSRYLDKDKLLVLIYHDVLTSGFDEDNPVFGMAVSVDTFESQMKYLTTHYNVVSLTDVLDWLAGKSELPSRAALITFDDGHRNNLTNAVPVLQRMHLSAVFFVTAGLLGTCSPTWFEEIYLRLMSTNRESIEFINKSVYPLGTVVGKVRACDEFFNLCRTLDSQSLKEQLQQLLSVLEPAKECSHHKERFEFLSVEDLQYLVQHGFHIGSHTVTHPILSTLSGESATTEVVDSCKRLSDALGVQVASFAYPFGDRNFDYTKRDVQLVKDAGCAIAFSGNSGLVDRSSDVFNLPRVGIGLKCGMSQFQCRISGSLDRTKSILRLA